MIVRVLLPVPLDKAFDYESDCSLARGQLVRVSFGGRELAGVVLEEVQESPFKTLKKILHVYDLPKLSENFLAFLSFVADYNVASMGSVLSLVLGRRGKLLDKSSRTSKKENVKKVAEKKPLSLNQEQLDAADKLQAHVANNTFQVSLLKGVTGSGKTETYFRAIEKALCLQKNVLVLLPEIALSGDWGARFFEHFGFEANVWHSEITPSKRSKLWQDVLKGNASVVVGARSALFLPFEHLGLIIIDEEHDASFKQEDSVFYNARDMAIWRAKQNNAAVILSSATPSLETLYNVEQQKYDQIELCGRATGSDFATVHLVDMRQQKTSTWISQELQKAVNDMLQKKEQGLLFLNRKGYAPLTLCRSCGHRFCCMRCSSWLVEHRSLKKLVCHHCGFMRSMPSTCESCDAKDSLVACGPGVERVEEEVKKLFPDARTQIVTSDHFTSHKAISELMQKINNFEIDLLVGTQVMAKGHNFPALTLVGIIDGDMSLSGGDLRATEQTFQLLHQVCGRVGRFEKEGVVLLQTYMPEHSVMLALKKHDQMSIMEAERDDRFARNLPPFSRLVGLILSGPNDLDVQKAAKKIAREFPQNKDVELLGPIPAPLSKIKKNYRWRLLIKADRKVKVQSYLRHFFDQHASFDNVKIQIDVDPYSFY